MIIYFTDIDPEKCTTMLDDKRVTSSIFYTEKLLTNALFKHGAIGPFKSYMTKHKLSIWAGRTRGNYCWLLGYYKCLLDEYARRFIQEHSNLGYIMYFDDHKHQIPIGELESFPNLAFDVDISYDKSAQNINHAYELYLNKKWDTDFIKPRWYGYG